MMLITDAAGSDFSAADDQDGDGGGDSDDVRVRHVIRRALGCSCGR